MPALVFGDEVDPRIGTPATGPLIPQPHSAKVSSVERIVRQEPPTDVFELPATKPRLVSQAVQQAAQSPHVPERKTSRVTAVPFASMRFKLEPARLPTLYVRGISPKVVVLKTPAERADKTERAEYDAAGHGDYCPGSPPERATRLGASQSWRTRGRDDSTRLCDAE
jgi:hypothetical protein